VPHGSAAAMRFRQTALLINVTSYSNFSARLCVWLCVWVSISLVCSSNTKIIGLLLYILLLVTDDGLRVCVCVCDRQTVWGFFFNYGWGYKETAALSVREERWCVQRKQRVEERAEGDTH
jgi:hypothetical protein